MPSGNRQPNALRPATGTATPDAIAATPDCTAAYVPVTWPIEVGKSRFTQAGSTTFSTAIAMPIKAVPNHSSASGGVERNSRPVASTASAMATMRSRPKRRASSGATGEITANPSSGRLTR